MSKQKYKHLDQYERYVIQMMIKQGYNITAIAKFLDRSKNTISLELRRNKRRKKYLCSIANDLYQDRLHKLDGRKIEKNPALLHYIIDKMRINKWGPDIIADHLKREPSLPNISVESIYKFIYTSPIARKRRLHLYLPSKKMSRQPQGQRKRRHVIPDRKSVHERDIIAQQKKELGHFEGDLTFHTGNQSMNIGCIVDKLSQKVILVLNKSKETKVVISGFYKGLKQLPWSLLKTLTLDNGTEFTNHSDLHKLGMRTYFCDPYRPRQKALVEKMNSMIHRILPKSRDIRTVTQKALDKVADILNNMPRKILGYKTPNECWNENMNSVLLSA